MSNMPTATSGSFVQTWIDALTKPRESTYSTIAASPRAKAMTGYVWVFLTSILTSIVTYVAQGAQIQKQLESAGTDLGSLGGGLGAGALGLVCAAPLGAIVGTLLFAIMVALVQWIAKMFGGKGTNDQLAYTLAAIAAPYSVVTAVFMLLSMIPYVGLCFNIVLGLGGLYVFVLQIMAVKGVNQFGWGQAIGSYLIPLAAIFLVCCVLIGIIAGISGAALGGIFSTINQSTFP